MRRRRQPRTRHARGLAQLATYLTMSAPPLLQDAALVVPPLPPDDGVLVWDVQRRQTVLQVDARGHVWHYQPGAWEQRLLQAVRRVADYVQVTLDLAGIELAEVVGCQQEALRHGGHLNPLEALGLRCLAAVQQHQEAAHGTG